VNIEKSTFCNCSGGYVHAGGVIIFEGAGSIKVLECIFTDCKSLLSGGVYFSVHPISLVLFKESNFSGCYGENSAGAMYIYGARNATITECMFYNCSAGQEGSLF
jgi:hypothetical protein